MDKLETDFVQSRSTKSTLPILTEGYEFFDCCYDSISAYSGSTVADSEFVAQQVSKYERGQRIDEINNMGKLSTVYNLHIDKLVIDGANPDSVNEKPVKEALDKFLINFADDTRKGLGTSDRKTQHETKVKPISLKRQCLVPILFLIFIIIGLACGLPMLFLRPNNDPNNEITSTTTQEISTNPQVSSPSTSISSQSSSSSSSESTTQSTTSEGSLPELKIIKREAWARQGLDINGKHKQRKPVKRIIITSTRTDSCYNENSCIDFILDNQQHAYPEFDDVQENFLLDMNGGLIEGRGFSHEGQTTCESRTCYNNKAVSVNFILGDNDIKASDEQLETLCVFIQRFTDSNDLDENYLMFHHSQLTSSYFDDQDGSVELLTEKCQFHLRKPPKIVKRRDWNATDFLIENNFRIRRISTKVVITTNQADTCDSLETCHPLLLSLQENDNEGIEYNFVFADNSLIFEGRGFDVASSETYDSLTLLYLGSLETVRSGELSNEILEFLEYSKHIAKLTDSFELIWRTQPKDNLNVLNSLL